jgi:hypothetical protein
MAKKIIFLDIDGVLNGHEWCHTNEGPRIFPNPARYLQIIAERTQSQVVLISSWRNWINRGYMTPKGFSRVLLTHGCRVDVIDALPAKDPSLSHAEDRTGKLLVWVEENKPTHYVVLDDLNLKVPNLIRPNPAVGLEPRHISEATEILNGR